MQQEAPRHPRASLWLFSYHGACDETWMCVLREMEMWGKRLVFSVKGQDANIDRARSRVASAFLETEYAEAGDVLLMVDSDNTWERGDLSKIAKRALEHTAVVGGIYPKKVFGQSAALRVLPDVEGDFRIGEDSLIPCEFVGTGFIAIPRAVLLAVGDTLPVVKGNFQPFFMPYVLDDPYQPEYPTDDQAFCHRVRAAGFNVYASTWPRVRHVGQYEYRMVDSYVSPPEDRDVTLHLEHKEAQLV